MKIYYNNSYLMSLFDNQKLHAFFDGMELKDVKHIQLYDDYLSEKFVFEGHVYYPVTLIKKKGTDIHWIRWKMNTDSLTDSYKKLDAIESADADVPEAFKKRMSQRAFYFDRKQSFPFVYDNKWEVTSKIVNNCYYEYLDYSPEKHIEQRLLDDIAYQLTQSIISSSPREGIINEDYNFFLPSVAYKSPTFRDNKWFFPIGIRDHYAFDLNIWVSSPQRIMGGVEKLDIEICESIDESIFDECYRDLIQSGFKPAKNIMEFSPEKIIEFLEARPAKKYKTLYR